MTQRDEERRHMGWPAIDTDFTLPRPMLWHLETLSELREQSPFTFNDSTYGFWMVNRYEHVREALQTPEVFSNRVTGALGDPKIKPRLLPQNLDGRDHVEYRHVVNPWFSPQNVIRSMPFARRRTIELIEELEPRGRADLTTDFAMLLPTEVFLVHMGLPTDDGMYLLPHIEALFRGFFGGDPDEMAATVAELKGYYQRHIDDRKDNPRDTSTDFLSYLLQTEVDGQLISEDDVLTLTFTIMIAGLDTTRSALGYIFHHLATHPDDRQWLLDDLTRIPQAVEEFVRLYTLVIQDGRFVTQDIDFHGCPMKQGDIVWLGLASANRDPRQFECADQFVRERQSNKHLGFGAGAHRCLGAHLARHELVIVLEEWLPRIPHFELVEGVEITERGGQLMLHHVPLTWPTE